MRRCWHRWTRWIDRPDLDALSPLIGLYQERRCLKCKLAEVERH